MPFDGVQINETAAHLIKAKELIRSQGWCPKGAGDFGTGPHCVVAAIARSDVSDPYRYASAIKVFIEANEFMCFGSIIEWNDTPGRTLDEVNAAFDRAIAFTLVR